MHIRSIFVEYRKILIGSRWLYLGNNVRADIRGIKTYQLELQRNESLILYDVLYVLWNLILISSLFALGYKLNFEYDIVNIIFYINIVCYDVLSNGFFTLEVLNNLYCVDIECFDTHRNIDAFT